MALNTNLPAPPRLAGEGNISYTIRLVMLFKRKISHALQISGLNGNVYRSTMSRRYRLKNAHCPACMQVVQDGYVINDAMLNEAGLAAKTELE